MHKNNNLIEIKDLTIKYKNNKNNTFENINLNIEKGSIVAFVGESGVGKTSFFHSLLKDLEIVKGKIEIFNKNIYELDKKEWKKILKNMSYLNQNPILINHENVFNNILKANIIFKNKFCSFFRIHPKNIKLKIFELLDKLNLIEKAFTIVDELSGGQKQRVEIIKALIRNSEILLADEPTANLDYFSLRDVINLFLKIKHEYKKTILLNIHDLSLIDENFDKVVVFKNKQINGIFDKENIDIDEIKKCI
ncbi:ATP-binding cassette domain-containing protein [Mycoplasmopsis meleagridis]|uniref:ATP-binding cassette domain-containing protein n=1 Tax=Mycoplasmopsis meleagridis TaxID=29561 RepID=UPI003A84A77A